MQQCCGASVSQPRQAIDQLFTRIEKIVTGCWISSRSLSLNGCENEMVVRAVIDFLPFARKHMNMASAQKPPDLETVS